MTTIVVVALMVNPSHSVAQSMTQAHDISRYLNWRFITDYPVPLQCNHRYIVVYGSNLTAASGRAYLAPYCLKPEAKR